MPVFPNLRGKSSFVLTKIAFEEKLGQFYENFTKIWRTFRKYARFSDFFKLSEIYEEIFEDDEKI